MTYKEMCKERERLYNQVNWNSRESIYRYNEAVKELRRRLAEQEDKVDAHLGYCGKDS